MGPARTYLLLEKKSLRGGACKAQIGERPGLQVQRGLILFSASITMCWSHVCLFDPLGQPFEVGANVTFSQEGNLQHRSAKSLLYGYPAGKSQKPKVHWRRPCSSRRNHRAALPGCWPLPEPA